MLATSDIIMKMTASANVLVSSSDSGHLTKKEVVCFVNDQMGVSRVWRYHVASNHDCQPLNLLCSIFIIRGLKLAVAVKVAYVVPELGKFSSPIKEEELF